MSNKKPLKVLVVEDETFIAEMIRVMLEDIGHHVPFVSYNESHAKEVLQNEAVDFAIFDINLKNGMEGVDLAKIAQRKEIPFMFLTSYSDRRTLEEAKKTKPGAYVIKPFTEDELFTAIEMSLMHASGADAEMITIKDGHRNILVKMEDVMYLKADNIYIEIQTVNKRYLTRQSLSAFIKDLPKDRFIRVHRSYAVNRSHIVSISRNSLEIGKETIPISRSYREEVQLRLK
ncbi:MAG: DNA-binding response regulator [Salibacteraceae bacterium]